MIVKAVDKSWSWQQLVIIFLSALLFFSLSRWDASAFVKTKLDTMIAQNKFDITYASRQMSGLNLELKSVHIKLPNIPKEVVLDNVNISPDWLAFVGFRWAVIVDVHSAQLDVSASIAMQDEQLEVHDLLVQADVAALQTWMDYPLPVQLAGQARLKGEFDVNIHSGLPLAGNLSVVWHAASLQMMQQEHGLGDYKLALTLQESVAEWSIYGGQAVKLEGKGTLNITASPVATWPVAGDIDVQTDPQSSIAQLLPKQPQHITIHGVLAMPKWQLGIAKP